MFKRNQRGDTILEVLISVAVLALILTTTFALANRNSQATRQAAERGEAQKMAQSQMEKLKLYLSSSGAEIPDYGSYFCMNQDGTDTVEIGSSGDGPNNPFDDKTFQSPVYQNAERESQDCKDGINGMYYSFLQRGEVAAVTQNLYTAIVRWPAVTGNGVDQVMIVHIIHPEIAGQLSSVPICIVNNNIAVALDNSGSMDFPYGSGVTRMAAAKDVLNDFFSRSEIKANGNRASLSYFSGDDDGDWRGRTVQSMTAQYQLLVASLQGITPEPAGPGTNYLIGMNLANTELVNTRAGDPGAGLALILITDGLLSSRSTTQAQVIARAQQIKNDGIAIYAIGILPGNSSEVQQAESLLTQVASPGRFTSADNPTQLEATLNGISNTLDC